MRARSAGNADHEVHGSARESHEGLSLVPGGSVFRVIEARSRMLVTRALGSTVIVRVARVPFAEGRIARTQGSRGGAQCQDHCREHDRGQSQAAFPACVPHHYLLQCVRPLEGARLPEDRLRPVAFGHRV
jgi:hypothetical protein